MPQELPYPDPNDGVILVRLARLLPLFLSPELAGEKRQRGQLRTKAGPVTISGVGRLLKVQGLDDRCMTPHSAIPRTPLRQPLIANPTNQTSSSAVILGA
jgi:hypothetical protein